MFADPLRYIVDHQLAPSVLARSAFCERVILSEEGFLIYEHMNALKEPVNRLLFIQQKRFRLDSHTMAGIKLDVSSKNSNRRYRHAEDRRIFKTVQSQRQNAPPL